MELQRALFCLSWAFMGTLAAQEICTNGVDDDADGLIDLNDTLDCVCGLVPVQLFDILPNPSFEDHECIPTSFSQMDCAAVWRSATNSTADYFRTEGYMPTFIQQPLPGSGSGCVGGYFCSDYREYIGGCLLQPLLSGQIYDLRMYESAVMVDNFLQTTTLLQVTEVDVTIYGSSTCPAWPINATLCPEEAGWVEIGHASYTPANEWNLITATLTPVTDIQAIIIGSPCFLPTDYPSVSSTWLAYFLMDELSISTIGSAGAPITSEGSWCDGDLVLTADPEGNMSEYQWYQNGIAILGATDTVLAVSALALDSGDYVFRTVGDTSCALSTFHVDNEIAPLPYIALTVDGLWCPLPGTYQWFLNGSLVLGATDAYYDPAENGTYTVQLTNAQGCSTISYPFDWYSTGIMPNAAQGINLSFSTADATLHVRGLQGRSTITVSDASGRVVFSTEFIGSDHDCLLANTAHGVYMARINDRMFRFVR